MKELVNHRTENSKTYDLGGGKRRLVASVGAIHYKDNYADFTEPWKDIDLTIRDGRIATSPYELTIDGKKLTFRDKKTGEVSTIERVSVSPPGVSCEVIPEFSAIRFRHILPSDKIPFEAKFKVTGKAPITRAFDDEGELELETSLVDGVLTEKLSQVKDKTGQVRPAKGNIRIDPTWQVGDSSDDTEFFWDGSAWQINLTDANFWVGYGASTWYKGGGGMRFANVTIPQGATIDQAYLTFHCKQAWSTETVNTKIIGELSTDAATFSTVADYQSRRGTSVGGPNDDNRTVAEVLWDNIGPWSYDVDYNSPESKTVVQEIINQSGWASGSALALFWDDHDDRSTHADDTQRRAYTYDSSTTYAPKLVADYTTVTIPTVTTEAVDNIQATQADGHGTIADTGGENAHTRGVCWNTTGSPTTADSKAEDDGAGSYGAGSFTKTMINLSEGTTYYVRAYAINSAGTGYGGEVSFITEAGVFIPQRKLGHSPTRLIG